MSTHHPSTVAVIGGGPAGLMAAEVLAQAGIKVSVFEAKPSLGRKFLRAGVGGLNLTHDEHFDQFSTRFGACQASLQPWLDLFGPGQVRAWAAGLGIETFAGSSGKVFPVGMKAAPLLRAWVARLQGLGVAFHMRHRWQGWGENAELLFGSPDGVESAVFDATVLALGGASWSKLGSDGAWVPLLAAKGVHVAPLKSANSGFDVHWSPYLRDKFAGTQLKSITLTVTDTAGFTETRRGEMTVSRYGLEGSLVYAFSARLREVIRSAGTAVVYLDLLPDHSQHHVEAELSRPRGARSLSSHLQSRLGLTGVKVALLHEVLDTSAMADPFRLARTIKKLPISLLATRPLEEAISTAGGVSFSEVDANLMLKKMPGVFVAGEMLDWEAPTGGYLLTACLALGAGAGQGVVQWLTSR